MAEVPGVDEFDDVNSAVEEEWRAETTPHERVKAVVRRAYEPTSSKGVADAALVSPKTARKHLESLANDGFVEATPNPNGGTSYRRSPESLVVEQAADILEKTSIEELSDRVRELRETLQEFRIEYGVESPEELSVETAVETLTVDDGTRTIDEDDVRAWRRTRRNLAFATAALSIANAERYVTGTDSNRPADASPTQ